jgi:hypothetical protein
MIKPCSLCTPSPALEDLPFFGWFPIDGLEIGLNPFSLASDLKGNSNLMFLVAPAYNFKTASGAYPFIEVESGVASSSANLSSETLSGFIYGGRLGVKIALNNSALFNISLQYLHWSYSYTNYTTTYNSNNIPLYSASNTTTESYSNIIVALGFTVAL